MFADGHRIDIIIHWCRHSKFDGTVTANIYGQTLQNTSVQAQ